MRIPGVTEAIETGWTIRATADSNGLAQGAIGPVPAGYCWYVERYSTFNPRANSVCEIFALNSEKLPSGFTAAIGDRAGRLDVSITANNAAADNAAPLYVGEGYWLVAFWSGLTSGDLAQLSTQIAIHRKALVTMLPWEQQQSQADYRVPDPISVDSGLGKPYTDTPGRPIGPLVLPGSSEGGLTDEG